MSHTGAQMYLYEGSVFRMWNIVLQRGTCMLVVDVVIITICIYRQMYVVLCLVL